MPSLDPLAASHDTDSPRRLVEKVNLEPFELKIDARGRIQVPHAVRETMLAQAAGPL